MSADNHPAQPTSLSLLRRAQANDQPAWCRLTALYKPLVLFWCRQARCPDAEVEDVAQEVFAAVAAGLAGFRRERPGDSFRCWLRGITRNQVLMHFRRNQGRPRPAGGAAALDQLHAPADPPSDAAEADEEVRQ